MRRIFIILLIFLPLKCIEAQIHSPYLNYSDFYLKLQQNENDLGEIKIIQDARVNELVVKHVEVAGKVDGIPGYRIRIYSNSGQSARQEANQAKSSFFQNFPDIPVYLDFQYPNYKLYAGDYHTKSEAQKSLNEIKKVFRNAFIVSSIIKVPGLE